MKVTINHEQAERKYVLKIEMDVAWNIKKVWDYMATNNGFQQWFPALSIDKEQLHFDMEDIHLSMPIYKNKKREELYFGWDIAKVKFNFESNNETTKIKLTEEMPYDFPNIENDFGGWLIHMTRLEKIFNHQEPQEINALKDVCEGIIRYKMSKSIV